MSEKTYKPGEHPSLPTTLKHHWADSVDSGEPAFVPYKYHHDHRVDLAAI